MNTYDLTVNGVVYTVLEPTQPDAYRVREPSGQVLGFACEDSSVVLDAEWLAALLATPQTVPAAVPESVRAAALRYVLNGAGLRAAVENAIAQADQNARDAWEYETTIRRDHDLVAGLAVTLDLSSAEVDALFIQAAAL